MNFQVSETLQEKREEQKLQQEQILRQEQTRQKPFFNRIILELKGAELSKKNDSIITLITKEYESVHIEERDYFWNFISKTENALNLLFEVLPNEVNKYYKTSEHPLADNFLTALQVGIYNARKELKN